jgi:hypothetical protein
MSQLTGLYLRMDGNKIISIDNLNSKNYYVCFKQNNEIIYTAFLGACLSITIPFEIYEKWNPLVSFTVLD